MENNNSELIVSQDGEVSSLPVSMQVYQAIYNEITGKTETITDSYNNYLILELADLFQLEHLLNQFLEQYQLSAFNVAITIFHSKATKERFSSFERLKIYNVTNNSPIERISIELNILITPPKLSKPQNYKISINIVSGATVIAKTKPDLPVGVPGMVLMRAVQRHAVKVEIEYIDYIIARSFSEILRSWVTSIKEQKPNNKLKSLQKKSHFFRLTSELLFFIMSIIITVTYAKLFLANATQNYVPLVQYLLISGCAIILSKQFGSVLGRSIEHKVDSINTNEMSFIHINAGDKKQYVEFQDNLKDEKWDAWKSGFIAMAIGVLSSIAATIIYNSLLSQ